MALTSGARVGPYEIISAAGAGGVGEVYRGRDTRLDRTVAIKIPILIAAIHGSDLWRTRWSLRNHFRSRCRRDGRGVSRTRYETRPHGRDQDSDLNCRHSWF